MTRVRPLEIIRFFYSTSLDHIPLVQDLSGELEGYLSRDLINRQLSDLQRAHLEYDSIPADWVDPDISREDLLKLSSQCPVPVLNRAGQKKSDWSDTELLRHASDLKERRATESEQAGPVIDPLPESSDQWFARLVLAAIPHPILATDLNGHALFYNEGFQQRVLQRAFFHNNLALAESYFLELTRGLLARVYSEGPHPADLLFASIPELSISVEITTIHRESQVSGYLYIFQDPELSGIPHEVLSRLERQMSLDEIMEELEAGIIASMLRRNGQNISHAAQALRINRSTLQNKIKRLKVNERFARKIDGPVRRVRTGRAETSSSGDIQQESTEPHSKVGKDNIESDKHSQGHSESSRKKPSRPAKKSARGSSRPGEKADSKVDASQKAPGSRAKKGAGPAAKKKKSTPTKKSKSSTIAKRGSRKTTGAEGKSKKK